MEPGRTIGTLQDNRASDPVHCEAAPRNTLRHLRAPWAVTLASSYVHVAGDVAGARWLRTAAAVAAAAAVGVPVAGSVVRTVVGTDTFVAADEGVSTRRYLVAVVVAAAAFPRQPP